MRTILVTGAAGFIGSWTCEALLARGDAVVGVDDFNPYYACEVFNLGNSQSVALSYFIQCISRELDREAKLNLLPLQPGDVPETFADIGKARRMLGFCPAVGIEEGVREFVRWYQGYFQAAPLTRSA